MNSKIKELTKRSLSGGVFVITIILLLGMNALGMLGFILLINLFALNEFYNLSYKCKAFPYKLVGILTGSFVLLLSFFVANGTLPDKFLSGSVLILLLPAIAPMFYQPAHFISSWVYTLTGILYITLPLALMPFIAIGLTGGYEPFLLLGVLTIIWIYDSFAYIVGIGVGRHRIYPVLSPKKSWEGFAGGTIVTLLVIYWLSRFFPILGTAEWLGMSLLIIVTATLGDFLESAIKRNAGVKDSGRFMPGHGGVLDRFDSFLFSLPFVSAYLWIILG